MIKPYKDKKDIYHYTNNGQYKYIQPEYNELIYTGDDKIITTPFIREILKYTGVNKPEDILYIKGDISELEPYNIGEGSEAKVINNTPFSVLKVLSTSPKLMKERNAVPSAVPCSLRAIVENNDDVKYIYHQVKVNIIPKEDITFAFKRLDIIMMKCGFFQVIGYSDDNIRVYADGFSVIDDIGFGNIGKGLDDKIHIVDCSVHDINDWELFNGFKIPNKVACIAYNNGDRQIDGHLEAIAKDINVAIKKYEDDLDKFLKENNITFNYEHINID